MTYRKPDLDRDYSAMHRLLQSAIASKTNHVRLIAVLKSR